MLLRLALCGPTNRTETEVIWVRTCGEDGFHMQRRNGSARGCEVGACEGEEKEQEGEKQKSQRSSLPRVARRVLVEDVLYIFLCRGL